MIRLQDLTPSVYYDKSRDFQFIGRLYDVVLNAVKTNADMIYTVPDPNAAGSKLIDLLALTLGFKAVHNYNVKQLTAICSILPTIIKNKGSLYALKLAGNTLLATADGSNALEEFNCEISKDGTSIEIFIPECDVDITLFNDLLAYILPAGMTSTISRAVRIEEASQTVFKTISDVMYWNNDADALSVIVKNEAAEKTNQSYIQNTPGYVSNSIIYGGCVDVNAYINTKSGVKNFGRDWLTKEDGGEAIVPQNYERYTIVTAGSEYLGKKYFWNSYLNRYEELKTQEDNKDTVGAAFTNTYGEPPTE